MPSWRGVFVGALGLIALGVLVRNKDSAPRLESGLTKVADLVRAFADPTVPAIPDLAGVSTAGGSGDDDDDGIPDWLDDPPFPFGPLSPLDPLGPLGPGVDIPGVPLI